MKISTIISEIVQLAITIAFVWFIFTIPQNRFEAIVLSGLIIILANVVHTRMILPLLISTNASIILNILHQIYPHNIDLNKYVTEQMEHSKSEIYHSYISTAYYLVFTFIGIIKLITVLFY